MKPSLHLALLSMALAATVGCSGSSNFLGGNLEPTGNLVLSNPQTGATFTTSAAHPLDVDGNAYSIGITETNFGGPYTVTSYSYDTGFNEPCYVPHVIDDTDHTNIVQFRPDNGGLVSSTGTIPPNPCNPNENDLETWLITDGKGHDLFFYTYLPYNPVIVAPSTTAPSFKRK